VGLLAPFIFYIADASITGVWHWTCVVLHWVAIVAMGVALILTVVSGVNYCIGAWKLRRDWLAAHPGQKPAVSDPDNG